MGFMKPSRRAAAEAAAAAEREAAAARAREEERRVRLEDGRQKIDGIFGGIGDDYYSGISRAILEAGAGDLNDQYAKARENLQYSLARSGMLSSSAATAADAGLNAARDEANAKVALQADQQKTRLRQQTAQEKQTAMQQLYATENPDLAANTALTGKSLIMSDKPSYNPIGDIFGSLINTFANGVGYANRQSAQGMTGNQNVTVAPPGQSGGRVIK